MLCTMCQHGVTSVIDGKPTGNVWWCSCGDTHCRHIRYCLNNGKSREESEISYEEAKQAKKADEDPT